MGMEHARNEFDKLIYFMSGKHPGECSENELNKPGNVKCMILIYEGENAIKIIRELLGPTNPKDAPDGTVRKEFGSNVMINTAHASDSKESYEREKSVVNIEGNTLSSIIQDFLKTDNEKTSCKNS